MEDNLYGITEDQLRNFAELELGIKYSNDAMVSDALSELGEFGRDIKEIESKVRGIINGDPVVSGRYIEIYTEKDELTGALNRGSLSAMAKFLNVDEGLLRRQEVNTQVRVGLERELDIETAHLEDFGNRLKKYLTQKTMADYKDGKLLAGRSFKQDPECESYFKSSETYRRLYDACMEEMPMAEIMVQRMKKSSKD